MMAVGWFGGLTAFVFRGVLALVNILSCVGWFGEFF